jgi:dynein heavy chain
MDKMLFLDEVVVKNIPGPTKYIETYAPYLQFLRPGGGVSKAEESVDGFVEMTPSLAQIEEYIKTLTETRAEISALRSIVPMELVQLDASSLHVHIVEAIDRLLKQLVDTVAARNKKHNRTICEHFDVIANRLITKPTDADAMAHLEEFIVETKTKTMHELVNGITVSKGLLRFLIRNATLLPDEVALNATTLSWPDRIAPMFDTAQGFCDEKRIASEKALKDRLKEFEAMLESYRHEIEVFEKKDDSIRPSVIKANFAQLTDLKHKLEAARNEAESIEHEEEILEFDKSEWPQLDMIETAKKPCVACPLLPSRIVKPSLFVWETTCVCTHTLT